LLPGALGSSIGIASNPAAMTSKLPEGIPMKPATPTLEQLRAQLQHPGAQPGQVQLASYETPADTASTPIFGANSAPQAATTPERRMTTTSISLPENFRVQGGGSPNVGRDNVTPRSLVQPGHVVQAGNLLAQPQSPPPTVGATAAPISYPAVQNVQGIAIPAQPARPQVGQLPYGQQLQAAHPGFMTPQQSPLGNGFVAPLQPAVLGTQQPVPQSVGQMGVPPTAPIMAGQPPLTTASGWATVTYPTQPAMVR
jgi:hypothetical protein